MVIYYSKGAFTNLYLYVYNGCIYVCFATGMDDPNSPFISLKNALKDEKRVIYYNGYLTNLLAAIK